MGRRKTISREFFAGIAATLVLGLAVMCGIQTALSSSYFARERQTALSAVLDRAVALCVRWADLGNIIVKPDSDMGLRAGARESFRLFLTSSDAEVFVADADGNVLLYTGDGSGFTGAAVPQSYLDTMDSGEDLFEQSTLGGAMSRRHYTVGRTLRLGGVKGYLFVATPMDALKAYIGEMLSIFVLSAALMLMLSGLLSLLTARRISAPIAAISAAARRLGGGDFTARAPASEYEELADFADTFNNMAARLQTIDNARGQFMGNIAHELRTPMTSIKGFIDGMLDGTIPPEEDPKYLAIVSQETGRLARLVQNMLDITRLEAGEVPIHAREYDIWQTVNGVVLADEQRIEDGRIDIQGLGGGRLNVYADPDLVHQVVYNFVDNAIKFTPAGGTITFAAAAHGGEVTVSVQNTGAGIPADVLPHVFERFYKEDRSRGLNTRGAGLGLHICKVLITLQGGSVRVESEEGSWARFSFTLPAHAPALPPADGPAPRPKRQRKRKQV